MLRYMSPGGYGRWRPAPGGKAGSEGSLRQLAELPYLYRCKGAAFREKPLPNPVY